MPDLEHVSLQSAGLYDEAYTQLSTMTGLKSITIENSPVSQYARAQLDTMDWLDKLELKDTY
jgi:hypothetical protein